jgi:hypothetical protein
VTVGKVHKEQSDGDQHPPCALVEHRNEPVEPAGNVGSSIEHLPGDLPGDSGRDREPDQAQQRTDRELRPMAGDQEAEARRQWNSRDAHHQRQPCARGRRKEEEPDTYEQERSGQ